MPKLRTYRIFYGFYLMVKKLHSKNQRENLFSEQYCKQQVDISSSEATLEFEMPVRPIV